MKEELKFRKELVDLLVKYGVIVEIDYDGITIKGKDWDVHSYDIYQDHYSFTTNH